MINWQECIVAISVGICVLWIMHNIYLFFHRIKKKQNPCDNCVSGCELKKMMDKKKEECIERDKKIKKNCCE